MQPPLHNTRCGIFSFVTLRWMSYPTAPVGRQIADLENAADAKAVPLAGFSSLSHYGVWTRIHPHVEPESSHSVRCGPFCRKFSSSPRLRRCQILYPYKASVLLQYKGLWAWSRGPQSNCGVIPLDAPSPHRARQKSGKFRARRHTYGTV
jgi:hypothetical protein